MFNTGLKISTEMLIDRHSRVRITNWKDPELKKTYYLC